MLNIDPFPFDLPDLNFPTSPPFGTVHLPFILETNINASRPFELRAIWHNKNTIEIPLATAALHYGQSIFEGLKAQKHASQKVSLFRVEQHAQRLSRSAEIMRMAPVSANDVQELITSYVQAMQKYVPGIPEHSLYLRPIMFATDPVIKVGPSKTYSLFVMGSIVGNYFGPGGQIKPAKVLVHKKWTRAFDYGTGEAKTAANYALSLNAQGTAQALGFDQVLYLDSEEHRYIDELGGMNFFAIEGKNLLTPRLNGRILRGVTRDSLLQLAPKIGLEPKEMDIDFDQLVKKIQCKQITEIFACGTAAVVNPIEQILIKHNDQDSGELIKLEGPFEKTLELRRFLVQIQKGANPDFMHWHHFV